VSKSLLLPVYHLRSYYLADVCCLWFAIATTSEMLMVNPVNVIASPFSTEVIASPQLAQLPEQSTSVPAIQPFTITDRLDENSNILDSDRSYYNTHTFEGIAEQAIVIEMSSDEFDTYLLLIAPNGKSVAQNDDSGGGINSRIVITLPITGMYTILATSSVHSQIGSYTLSLRRASSNDLTLPEADRLYQEGIEQFSANQIQGSLQFFQQALQIYRDTGDQAAERTILNSIGGVYYALGQYSNALEYYQQALSVARLIGDRAGEGGSLNNTGSAYESLGYYFQALEYYQQALFIAREVEDRTGEQVVLNNIGLIYHRLGQYSQALEYYQQSLSIAREIQKPEEILLNNIGGVYDSLGQYLKALEYYQDSLVSCRESNNRAGEGLVLNNIGLSYSNLEQYSQALNYFQDALAISREVGNRAQEGRILNNIGVVYDGLNQYLQALEYYQQALFIRKEIGDRAGEATTLNNIGLVYDHLEQYQQSLEQYQQSLNIKREIGDRAGEATTLNNIGFALIQLDQFTQAEEVLYTAIEIWESLRDVDLSNADQVAIFETQRFTYQALERTLVVQNQPDKILRALEVSERGRARALINWFSSQLGNQNIDDFSANIINISNIQDVANQKDSTLIQYSLINAGIGAPILLIWVIQPDGQIHFRSVNLADLEVPLSDLIITSREAIGARGRDRATIVPTLTAQALERQRNQEQENLQKLYQLLIEPIAQYLPTNPEERVVFIPQGELFLVPFPALMDANGDYLIKNHTILTAPSIQVLGLMSELRQSNNTRSSGIRNLGANDLLVVGNPIMPSVWNPETGEEQQLPSLSGAEAEATDIAALFGTEALMLDEATEQTVRQRMQNAQVIHLATHGLLEYGNPQESGVRDFPGAIALAPDSTFTSHSLEEAGRGDGLLTASEILDINLQADLVVLSACDTGRGRITGDGVIGLSRSFIQAGVPSVIVSLWSVPDAPTASLMTEFYRQWQQNQDKAQALRQAMLITMQTHPDPRNWAAFTLIGEAE
jgi:CHAT domain-containing protein